MKIVLISGTFPPVIGGIEEFSYELAKHLSEDKRIDKVAVITFSDKIVGRESINKKLDVIRIHKSNFMKMELIFICELFKRRKYDVFHNTSLGISSFQSPYFAKLFAHKKSFVTVYGLDALSALGALDASGNKRISFGIKSFIIKRIFDRVDKIIAFSDSTRTKVEVAYRLRTDKLRTIYPGVSVPEVTQAQVESLRKKFNINKEDFVVLFVGRLVERKGADDLIHALARIDEKENIKLLIVGDGPEKSKLLRLRNKLRMDDRILFAGMVPHQEVFPFYKLANVFCMPSKYLKERGDIEGLGIVFLEAQSYGVPVIGTNSGGIPEAIDNLNTGFIVPESDPNAIKEKILQLKNDEDLYMRMSNNAIKFVKKKFTWEKCINNHIELYKS